MKNLARSLSRQSPNLFSVAQAEKLKGKVRMKEQYAPDALLAVRLRQRS